ncbi:hypothetical protein ACLOJK_017476 [Asimina triloba]
MRISGRYPYQQISEARRRRGFPARIWVSLTRAAAKSLRFYVGRRRILAAGSWLVRRVVWMSLDLKRRVARSGRARHAPPPTYDAFSYSQNFDDGRWQQEDVDFYGSRSFAFRYAHAGVFIDGSSIQDSSFSF